MPTAEKRKAIRPAPKPPSSDDSDAESDDEQVAKQQKQRDDDAAKAETALSTFHGQEAEYVYEAIDPETSEVFYVGRTNDLYRRCYEHDKTYIKKMRELMKLKNFKFRDVVRRVLELPNGCDPGDVKDMEAFFIFRRGVLYHPEYCPHGCNSKLGDGGINMTSKRYEELKHTFSADGPGYYFPAKTHQEDELKNLHMEKAIAEKTAKMAEEMGENEVAQMANKCATLATNELHEHECKRMGLRAHVEHVLADYEHLHVDAVDKHTLQVKLNAIREKTESDDKFKDLRRIPRSLSLATQHPVDLDGNPRTDVPVIDMPSEAVRDFLNGMLKCILSREEAHLVWTNETTKTNMLKVRAWSRANGMKRPAGKKGTEGSEEYRLSRALTNWKIAGCKDLACCDVVMCSLPWWRAFIHSKEDLAERLEECVRQVRAGYGLKLEPPFPGKKTISGAGTNAPVYQILENLVRGQGTKENKERLFAVLKEQGRLDWYKEKHDAALAARKGQGAKENGSEEEGEEEE